MPDPRKLANRTFEEAPPSARNGGRLVGRSAALDVYRGSPDHAARSSIDAWSTALTAPPVQLQRFDDAIADLHDSVAVGNHEVWGDPLPAHLSGGVVQLRARRADHNDRDSDAARDPQSIAAAGTRGGASPLPYAEQIQAAFGDHDIGAIRAYTGGPAREANEALGAVAYASGDAVAFAAAPDLHTAAHEAAHIVQQRAGVSLKGGIGQVGDRYERHADAVADAVVRGESAEPILNQMTGGAPNAAVQQRACRTSVDAAQKKAVQRQSAEAEPAKGAGKRAAEQASEELDRRTEGDQPQEDGSGVWGAESADASLTDQATLQQWQLVAHGAEALGYVHSAAHMRHYLSNTGGAIKDLPVDEMLRDVPDLMAAYEAGRVQARNDADFEVATDQKPRTLSLKGPKQSDVYSEGDWYYAVGGFTYWWTAEVTVAPPRDASRVCRPDAPPYVEMQFKLHVHDVYNFDKGKSVVIFGVQVEDGSLGRLHRVGLACEFDVDGESSAEVVGWDAFEAGGSSEPSSAGASELRGSRADPSRKRK